MTNRLLVGSRVGIVDYGAGNLRSITNAFEHLGASVVRVAQASQTQECTHLVLPGVGAFGHCARRLLDSGLTDVLGEWALERQRPFLGICVGLQLLANGSDESSRADGLGWLGGQVRQLRGTGTIRIPHVGWNTVRFESGFGDFLAGDEADFYFDHSFAYGQPERGRCLATCTHGTSFSAVVARDNVLAAQFHPEKSQTAGLRFLRGFLK